MSEVPHATTPNAEQFDYQLLDSPELRMRYLNLTDNLVRAMVDHETDIALYLDKSARPVAWMVHSLWSQLVPPDEAGNPKFNEPDIKFANIDREQWGGMVGRSETGVTDISAIPEERIAELRAVFTAPGKEPESSDGEVGKTSHTMFDGKRVLVIDEVSNSGDTMRMATSIIRRAFPGAADITGAYWMHGKVVKDPKSGVPLNSENPIWYSDRVTTGRLVADRDTAKSARSNSSRQRIGGQWLSTRFATGPDEQGIQLRDEARRMAIDLENRDLLYTPTAGWKGIEDIGDKILRLTGLTKQEYVTLKSVSPNNELLHANYRQLPQSRYAEETAK